MLQRPAGPVANPVREYANYRASTAGGGYDTLVVNTDLLVDQFHYGDFSPGAIMRFMHFLIDNGNPQYLLLLGKAIDQSSTLYRTNRSSFKVYNLVPTGGFPGSDVVFTSNWKNNAYTPRVATGRVSAKTPAEVMAYLNKVKVHEALSQYEPWRKKMLHLGGGSSVTEMAQLRNYLKNYEDKAEGPLLGASVSSRYKTTTADFVKQINVSDEVNAGLSLITFFGHSSASTSDLDIGLASSPVNGYNNTGKYPMILMNGCQAGGAFGTNVTFGEDWLLTPERGAILYNAHVHQGYPHLLNEYSNNFYRIAFTDSAFYGKPVGNIQQQVLSSLTNLNSNDTKLALANQMLLQGDPAVALVAPEKPDYEVNQNSLFLTSFDNKQVTLTSDSIAVAIHVRNFGKALRVPLNVGLTVNDGAVQLKDFPAVMFQDTLFYVITNKNQLFQGINKFKVEVDYGNNINEENEGNNVAEFTYFIANSGIATLFPLEYSIVNSTSPVLAAQVTSFTDLNSKEFYFELDTTSTFKGGTMQKALLNGTVTSPYLAEWKVQLPAALTQKDSTVFYWRVRFKNIEPGADTIWANSSFRYIANSGAGWSQSHFQQFDKADLDRLNINKSKPRKVEFDPIYLPIELRAIGGSSLFDPPYGISINNNVSGWQYTFFCGYRNPTLYIALLNNKTLEKYTSMPTGLGTLCLADLYTFGNLNDVNNQNKLEQFLNSIPPDYYAIAISLNNVPFSTFSPSLKAAFNGIGSALIDNLDTGYPFAIVGQKGATPGSVQEITYDANDPTPASQQGVNLSVNLTANTDRGTITSTKVGPASQWTTLHHTISRKGADEYKLDVIGYDLQGNDSVLFKDVKNTSFSLASVDAKQFPYLQLRLEMADTVDRSAPDLKQWLVTYQGVPEGLMRPDFVGKDMYDLSNKALTGNVAVDFAYQNISKLDFTDSLTAEISILKDNSTPVVETVKLKPLVQNDTVRFSHQFSTLGMSGDYRMRVYVNPRILPEEYYFNNIMEIPFNVQGTDLHPILNVVFDGQHIMNGDIVSPRPVVSVTLKDEKNTRYLEDPKDMQLLLKGPNDPDFKQINVVNNPAEVRITKATKDNDFKLEFQPKESMPDGEYPLHVQGRDVSGNKSGVEPYRISFRVINKSTITHFYPYPNPFSSNTRFVFTLTGSVLPEDLKVQIMTVTGKVVREITKNELFPTGGMRIGNNTSEYAWDGRDEFGDKLANGVYLYRVVMDTGDKQFEHNRTSADKSFKKDYGKIYILR
ncbi:MAG: C25 family cysteine peptidase [Hymenobacteraceae bacterium]|nr:C25 family cysteine peptidase [Hymenobacteraceae bacterium]MDX5394754.1 C25 family cysteine peptidase [Hymenobacteraceae bacterium]MDX5510785.1 C25 family cysteine peptidase [Hymenobacteraceae bacterium]